MSSGHCSCPDCGTTLRVRDVSFVGRKIDCPECHAELLIEVDQHKAFIARRAPTPEKPKPAPQLAVSVSRVHGAISRRLAEAARSPLLLAWALAIGVTAFVAILMLRPTVRFHPDSAPQQTAEDDSNGDAANDKDKPQTVPNSTVAEVTETPDATGTDNSPTEERPGNEPMPSETVVLPAPKPAQPDPAVATTQPKVATTPSNVPTESPGTPAVPPPVKIDVEALLKQRLLSFKQPTPVSRRLMIELIEEMVGAPIRYDAGELGEKNLDKPVTLELENTTVGGILKAVLDAAGWEFVIEDDGLRLKPRQVAGPASR